MLKSRILKALFAVVVFVGLFGLWTVPVGAEEARTSWPDYSAINNGGVYIVQSPSGIITLYTGEMLTISSSGFKGEVACVSTKYNSAKYTYNTDSKNWVKVDSSSKSWSIVIYGNGPSGRQGTYNIYSDSFTKADLERVYAQGCARYGDAYASATGNLDNIVFYRPLLSQKAAEGLLAAPVVESLGAIRGLMICLVALVAGLVVLPTVLRRFRAR